MDSPVKVTIYRFRREALWSSDWDSLVMLLDGQAWAPGGFRDELAVGSMWYQKGGKSTQALIAADSSLLAADLSGTGLPSGGEKCDFLPIGANQQLLSLLFRLVYLQDDMSKAGICSAMSASYQLTGELYDALFPELGARSAAGDKAFGVLDEAKRYIDRNFSEQLSQSAIAKRFFLNSSYFSRAFHQQFGQTFSDYLRGLRVKEASRLLADTNRSITQISFDCGFPSAVAMRTAFTEELGMLPGKYRDEARGAKPGRSKTDFERVLLQDVSPLVRKYAAYNRPQEGDKRRSDTVDMSKSAPYRRFWSEILNAGSAAAVSRQQAQNAMKDIKDTVKYKYVRLSGIFKTNVLPFVPLENRFSYFEFFRIIDYLASLDALPVLNIASTPTRFGMTLYQEERPYHISPEEWMVMFKGIVEASIDRYGVSTVSRWRFELWLPRYWEKDCSPADMDTFVSAFSLACSYLKERLPGCKVGGLDISLAGNWEAQLEAVLSRLVEKDATPDFITFSFCGEPVSQLGVSDSAMTYVFGQSAIMSVSYERSEAYRKKAERLRKIVQSALPTAPELVLTEPVEYPFPQHGLNDGAHPAAFAVKTLIDLWDIVDTVGSCRLLNPETDYPGDDDLVCGGVGLVLREGILSPTGRVYQFLDRLGDRLVAKGDGFLVTASEDGRYQILLHNCQHHSDYFCRLMDKINMASFMEPALYDTYDSLSWSLRLEGLEKGEYLIHQYLLGDSNGNLATELERLNYQNRVNHELMEYLLGVTMPHQRFFRRDRGDALDISVSLQPNDVVLLEISPQ